jgi:hypothetical protein
MKTVKQTNYNDTRYIKLKENKEICIDDNGNEYRIPEAISIMKKGNKIFSFPIDYYCDMGGLVISPSQSYLLFPFRDHQSWGENFTLFKLSDILETVYDSPCLPSEGFVEGAGYCFSEDEKILMQIIPISCCPWKLEDDLEYIDEKLVKEDINGMKYYHHGYLNILNISKKTLSEHEIHIYSSSRYPYKKEFDPYTIKFIGSKTFKISMPWGNEIITLPLRNPIIFKR